MSRQNRPWWKKKRWWFGGAVAALLAVFLVCIYTIPRFPVGPYQLYTDLTPEQRAATIPYETLTNEQTHPFRNGGPAVPHRDAIARFPDVRDCLVESERTKPKPDLRLIDWDLFWTDAEAEVCLWRVYSSLGMSEGIDKWRHFHDIDGVRYPLINGLKYPNRGLYRFLLVKIIRSQKVGIYGMKEEIITDVAVISNIL